MLQQIASLVWVRTSYSNKVPQIPATGWGIIKLRLFSRHLHILFVFCGGKTRVQR